MNMFLQALIFVCLVFSYSYLHELGHYVLARSFGMNASIHIKLVSFWVYVKIEPNLSTDDPTALYEYERHMRYVSVGGFIGILPLILGLYISSLPSIVWIGLIIIFLLYSLYETVSRH